MGQWQQFLPWEASHLHHKELSTFQQQVLSSCYSNQKAPIKTAWFLLKHRFYSWASTLRTSLYKAQQMPRIELHVDNSYKLGSVKGIQAS